MTGEQKITEAQRKIMATLAPHPRATQVKILREALKQEEQSAAQAKARLAAVEGLLQWAEGAKKPILERNDCSRLHKLKEAARAGRLIEQSTDGKVDASPATSELDGLQHTFVVKHNWAAAFANAEGMGDEFRLPFDLCAFEFRIAARTIIALVAEIDGERQLTAFVETGIFWYGFGVSGADGVIPFIRQQIRAICIALDAEVATHSVVRAPQKLNEKRAKAGKARLSDYRVVDLSRRHRVAGGSPGDGGSKKRLHFRRGHWRHYEESKTWIKWMLAGDPDLGFISKHYSL